MAVKFTPGPWKWWTSCSWRRLSQDVPNAKEGGVLCPYVARDGHPDVMVSDDDARLIASAPELLEALQGVLWMAEEWFKHGGDETTFSDGYKESLDEARAAILKATGEA